MAKWQSYRQDATKSGRVKKKKEKEYYEDEKAPSLWSKLPIWSKILIVFGATAIVWLIYFLFLNKTF